MKRSNPSCLSLFVAACLAQPATAQIIVDAHGFEPPLFSPTFNGTGQLEEQGEWQRHPFVGASTAIVQTAVVANGNQAVRVDRAANSDARWDSQGVQGYPTGDLISIVWDMRVNQTSGPQFAFGPYFGVEAYDASGPTIGLLGSLGVDASTGDVLFQAERAGSLTETGQLVSFGWWHRYELRLDYSTKTYSYSLDGALLGTEGFVDEENVPGGLNAFTAVEIAAAAASGDSASQALTGTAYFDNFLVVDGVFVPTLAGDYNDDHTVDAADYVVWRKNFGTMNHLPNDPNGDTIDERQYNTWRANFGQTNGSGNSTSSARNAPEPSTAIVLLTLAVLQGRIARRRIGFPLP